MQPRLAFLISRFGGCWLLAAFIMGVMGADAAEVSARAMLSRGVTVIGDPIQYQIKVSGARRVGDPPDVSVDGLLIRFVGPSENSVVRFQNGAFTAERTTTLVYEVVAERNGSFTIPAAAIEADGKIYRTEPVGLTVQPSSAGAAENDPQQIGFAEFVVPKKTAYIGEMLPLELRLYVDARIRWQPVKMPDIVGEGFTMQKMPEPQRQQMARNGREYDVLIFKTAISPSRAGKLTIGPTDVPYNARVPRARKSTQRSPFDIFDDIFDDPFYSTTQQLKAKVAAVEIAVQPLPAEGKPREFSGAVGNFEFAAEGNPKQVKIGDPVTMKLRVSGQGNFDRMGEPALKDSAGWRWYPPTKTFKADDEIGVKGTKTFEMAVVPETPQTEMPVFQFSFFDPKAEKYVTLISEPAPLLVEGGAPPPPAPVTTSASEPPQPTPQAGPKADDMLGLRYDRDSKGSFEQIYERREFWVAHGALGFVLLGALAWRLRRSPDAAALEAAALGREKESALARLRDAKLGDAAFLDTAARVAQIETALETGGSSGAIDAAAVRAAFPLDESTAVVIDAIFSSRAELLYAGESGGARAQSGVDRERIVAALERLGKAQGHH